jgi:hypothetical protein
MVLDKQFQVIHLKLLVQQRLLYLYNLYIHNLPLTYSVYI